ncbi:MAG: glycoside hydrolase family 27 protein [Planctomycetota bacterium]|nr:MAG: glycoside hydrolase family 27 protein [Planctomycetota bacterium]
MGWNSYDAYDCRINEQEFRATVDFMAEHLLPHGWEYAVIDFIWFNPAPGAHPLPGHRFGHPDVRLDENGRPIDRLAMDQYGRLLPAVERFPSAADGKGFKPLADYVHGKGMKFGIHIMRGIPRQAYFDNTPILGTNLRARDIAEPWDTCRWCNNMFGVDTTKPGAQEYYDSLFQLYAEWGVDFVKADDMMFPVYHKGEIEAMHKAIRKCGRPIVLSLSCGEAPLGHAHHVSRHANMWRISADFWDNWESLRHNFDLLNAWSPFIAPGRWPDADMLPIGHLSLGGRPHGPDRQSQFTWPEHYTLMSLWCIARSPLMMGGDLLTSSEKSLSFLKNDEVLAVNRNSVDNRQVIKERNKVIWIATDPETGDRYLGLFNIGETEAWIQFEFEYEMLRSRFKIRDLWAHKDLGVYEKTFAAKLPSHGAGLYRMTKVST